METSHRTWAIGEDFEEMPRAPVLRTSQQWFFEDPCLRIAVNAL
jgi:hypothetical protein